MLDVRFSGVHRQLILNSRQGWGEPNSVCIKPAAAQIFLSNQANSVILKDIATEIVLTGLPPRSTDLAGTVGWVLPHQCFVIDKPHVFPAKNLIL